MSPEEQTINTSGGAYIEGSVQIGSGDFVGGDKIIYETHYRYVERPAPGIPYLTPHLPPHHIPREAELAELRRLLLGAERQVGVTALRGMGGVGKTTLAIALCHDKQIIEAFPDGILWATLGPQADLLSAQVTWGMALGADLTALPDAEARAARLRSLLRDQRCLLVIDDVWDANHLPSLQVGGSHCATLVTTRERKIAQKVGIARDLDVLEPEQAIALLERWAGEIAEAEKAVAGELARRLGYLPLALALAGAQTQDGQSWEGLLAVFRDAQGADITLLDLDDPQTRDESLTLAFSLSVDRLGEALPVQFALLGVFAAGREAPFEIEAAAAVWEVTTAQARKMLDRLVRAALLNRTGERYALHLLLGDYARSRLDETTRQAAEARHRAYYLEVARHSINEWQAAEAAWPQIQTAWSRLAKDDADGLFTWALATNRFFHTRGRWADKITWVKAALAAALAGGQRKAEAWCQLALAETFYFDLGKLTEALEESQASLAIAREIGYRRGEVFALSLIGRIQSQYGELDRALETQQAALILARELGDRTSEAWDLINIGGTYNHRGESDKALECYQESLAIMCEVGHRYGEAWAHLNIGSVYQRRGQLTQAMEQYQIGLTITQEVGDRRGAGYFLNNMGLVYDDRSDLAEALAHHQASLALWRELGDQSRQAQSLRKIARIYRQMRRLTEAAKHYVEALALFEAMGLPEVDEVRQSLEEVRSRLSQGENQS